MLGPIGMLLAVPLTLAIQIALEQHDETRWLSVLLGAVPEDEAGDELPAPRTGAA